jgi:hypothetical protein
VRSDTAISWVRRRLFSQALVPELVDQMGSAYPQLVEHPVDNYHSA